MIVAVICVYLMAVLCIGGLSHRLFRGTGEDYFVASRTIGPFLLLMFLFGTNMTAFSILGASGESYSHGIGVFGLILVITFVSSLIVNRSIFGLAIWSFTGFASLFPIIVAALFWRRTSSEGVIASILTVVVLWVYFFAKSWLDPTYTVFGTGLMPVVVIVTGACGALFLGSLVTAPVDSDVVDRILGRPDEVAR